MVTYWSVSPSSSSVSPSSSSEELVVEAVSNGVVDGAVVVVGAEEATGSVATLVDSIMGASVAAREVTMAESVELGCTTLGWIG
jgi:hypothetical protein